MKTEQLPNNFVRLTPDEGMQLYNTATGNYHSEAVVREAQVYLFKEVSL